VIDQRTASRQIEERIAVDYPAKPTLLLTAAKSIQQEGHEARSFVFHFEETPPEPHGTHVEGLGRRRAAGHGDSRPQSFQQEGQEVMRSVLLFEEMLLNS
jgi:hypothetical protein